MIAKTITNEAAVERLRDLLADAEHLAAKHKVCPAGYELDAEALRAAIAALEPWRGIGSEPHDRNVLVAYLNPLGKWRCVKAKFYSAGTLPMADEFDESAEGEFAEPGWYEQTETHEHVFPLEYAPAFWMPLPASPFANPSEPT